MTKAGSRHRHPSLLVPPVSLPQTGTKPARDFFEPWSEINRFLHWLTHMVVHFDQASEHAHKVLVETAPSEAEREKLESKWSGRNGEQREPSVRRSAIPVRHFDHWLRERPG